MAGRKNNEAPWDGRMSKRGLVSGLLAGLLCALLLAPGLVVAQEEGFAALLTSQERDYLKEDRLIAVAFSPNKGPIQYKGQDGEQKGISRDVLEQVSQLTGLRFSFITMSGMDQMRKAVDVGKVQILAGIPVEQAVRDAYAVDFSHPYMDCTYGVLLPRGGSLDHRGKLRLALTVGLDIPEGFQDVQEITRFDTVQDCIRAVSEGKADFTYGNSYVLEFYAQGYRYQNLTVVPLAGREQQICFGVADGEDSRLIGILDKSIRYIGQEGLTDIIVRNVAISTEPVTLASWISLNPRVSVCIGAVVLALIGAIAVLIINSSRRRSMFLRMEHQRYLLLSEVAKEYFYEYCFQTDTLVLNKETAEQFGTKEVFKKWSSVLKGTGKLEPANRKMLEQLYTTCLEADQPDAGAVSRGMEVELPVASGERRWFRLTRAVLYEHGRPAYSIGKLIDIEEEHKARRELMQKSVTDRMTGVYNGVAAKELIDRAAQNLRAGVLFMLDLDNFKRVNDRYGHPTGDRVIKEMADILRQTFRRNDIIGRVGGDEFIVFAENTADHAFIDAKCKELQEAVGRIQVGEDVPLSVSIGVAVMTPPGLYDESFQQADAALYFVKNHGRAGYHIFS